MSRVSRQHAPRRASTARSRDAAHGTSGHRPVRLRRAIRPRHGRQRALRRAAGGPPGKRGQRPARRASPAASARSRPARRCVRRCRPRGPRPLARRSPTCVGGAARRIGATRARDLDPAHRRDGFGLLPDRRWPSSSPRRRGGAWPDRSGRRSRPSSRGPSGAVGRGRPVRCSSPRRAGSCATPTDAQPRGRIVIGWAAMCSASSGSCTSRTALPAPPTARSAMRAAGGLFGFLACVAARRGGHGVRRGPAARCWSRVRRPRRHRDAGARRAGPAARRATALLRRRSTDEPRPTCTDGAAAGDADGRPRASRSGVDAAAQPSRRRRRPRRRRGVEPRGEGRARAVGRAAAGRASRSTRPASARPAPRSTHRARRCRRPAVGRRPAKEPLPTPPRAAARSGSSSSRSPATSPTTCRPATLLTPGAAHKARTQGQRRGHRGADRGVRPVRRRRAGHRLHPRPDRHALRGRARPGGQGRADHRAAARTSPTR